MKYFVDSGPIIGQSYYYKIVPYEKIKNTDLDPHSEYANKFFTKFGNNVTSSFVFSMDLPDFIRRRETATDVLLKKLLGKKNYFAKAQTLLKKDVDWVNENYNKFNKRYFDQRSVVFTFRDSIAKLKLNISYCKKNFFQRVYSDPIGRQILKELNKEQNLHDKDKNILCHAIQYHNFKEEIEVVTCDKDWLKFNLDSLKKRFKIPKINYLWDLFE